MARNPDELNEIKQILKQNLEFTKRIHSFFTSNIGGIGGRSFSEIQRKILNQIKSEKRSYSDSYNRESNSSVVKRKVDDIANEFNRRMNVYENRILKTHDILSKRFSYETTFFDFLSDVLNKIPFFGAALIPIPEILNEYTYALRKVSISTVDYQDGLQNVAIASQKLGMSLREYADFISNYAGAINRFGLPSVLRMAESVRYNSDYLYRMGLSVVEISNYFGEFLEQQRVVDGRRNRTENELLEMFSRQMKMIFEIARNTGKSFQQVFESIKDQITKPDVALLFRNMNEEVRNEVLKFVESVPVLRNVVEDYMKYGTIYFSEESDKMLITYASDIEKVISGLTKGTMRYEDAIRYLLSRIQNLSGDQLRTLFLVDRNSAEFASELKISLEKIIESFDRNFDERKIDKFSMLFLGLESAYRDVIASFRESFIKGLFGKELLEDLSPEELMTKFKESTEKFKIALSAVGSFFGEFTRNLVSELGLDDDPEKIKMNLFNMFEGIKLFIVNMNKFFVLINPILEKIKEYPLESLATIIGGGFILKRAIRSAIGKIKSLFGMGSDEDKSSAGDVDVERKDKDTKGKSGRLRKSLSSAFRSLRRLGGRGGLFGLGLAAGGIIGEILTSDDEQSEFIDENIKGKTDTGKISPKEAEKGSFLQKEQDQKTLSENLDKVMRNVIGNATIGVGTGLAASRFTGPFAGVTIATGVTGGAITGLVKSAEELKNIGSEMNKIVEGIIDKFNEKLTEQVNLMKQMANDISNQLELMRQEQNMKARERASTPLTIDIGSSIIAP